MAQVDFYVVASGGDEGAARVACKVAEKAWQKGFRVFVRTASAEAARHLDDLLWTFRQDSFVPHVLDSEPESNDEAVVVGCDIAAAEGRQVLVNLGVALPAELPPFERIAEVVSDGEEARRSARERYGHYRALGHDLKHHEVKP